MDILTRLKNLEKLVSALLEKIDRNQFYNNADIVGNRQSTYFNTSDISDNSDAIFELAELIAELEVQNG